MLFDIIFIKYCVKPPGKTQYIVVFCNCVIIRARAIFSLNIRENEGLFAIKTHTIAQYIDTNLVQFLCIVVHHAGACGL